MASLRSSEYLQRLIRELCALPGETEWVEFKESNANPEEVGEYISALANSAAVLGRSCAYLVWGVRNSDHAIVGTSFNPGVAKKGNENLENWLLRCCDPQVGFRFHELSLDGEPLVVLEIESATLANSLSGR